VTVEQIVRALMRERLGVLASVARQAMLPALPPPPLLTTEAVAHAAEVHVNRDRYRAQPLRWEEPAEAPCMEDVVTVPQEIVAWLTDLVAVVRGGEAVRLARLVPHRDAGESFLRASLLPLIDDGRAGEGIAGQLGAIKADVTPLGDGWPDTIEDSPLSALTPGSVEPRGL